MRRCVTCCLAVGASAIIAGSAPAFAQESFPAGPIQMIVPAPAGGGTDISMRVLASSAESFLRQKVIIINKPGGGGAVGMQAIAQAKPDGYTVGGVWNAPLTIVPHMFAVTYRKNDYATVGLSARTPGVFCVRKDFRADNGKEFIEQLRANPGKLTYGNDGVGGTLHLAAERIFDKLGVKARPIPFSGANENLNTLLTGATDIYAASMAPILPYVKQGSVKCLLLTSAERNKNLPNTDGLADLGIAAEATNVWRGVIAPHGIPPERMAKLEQAFERAAKDPRFVQFAESKGEQALGEDGKAERKLIDEEYAAMGEIVAKLGLQKK